MLQLAPLILSGNSRFITAGAFHETLQNRDKAIMVLMQMTGLLRRCTQKVKDEGGSHAVSGHGS